MADQRDRKVSAAKDREAFTRKSHSRDDDDASSLPNLLIGDHRSTGLFSSATKKSKNDSEDASRSQGPLHQKEETYSTAIASSYNRRVFTADPITRTTTSTSIATPTSAAPSPVSREEKASPFISFELGSKSTKNQQCMKETLQKKQVAGHTNSPSNSGVTNSFHSSFTAPAQQPHNLETFTQFLLRDAGNAASNARAPRVSQNVWANNPSLLTLKGAPNASSALWPATISSLTAKREYSNQGSTLTTNPTNHQGDYLIPTHCLEVQRTPSTSTMAVFQPQTLTSEKAQPKTQATMVPTVPSQLQRYQEQQTSQIIAEALVRQAQAAYMNLNNNSYHNSVQVAGEQQHYPFSTTPSAVHSSTQHQNNDSNSSSSTAVFPVSDRATAIVGLSPFSFPSARNVSNAGLFSASVPSLVGLLPWTFPGTLERGGTSNENRDTNLEAIRSLVGAISTVGQNHPCNQLQRNQQHFLQYLFAQTGHPTQRGVSFPPQTQLISPLPNFAGVGSNLVASSTAPIVNSTEHRISEANSTRVSILLSIPNDVDRLSEYQYMVRKQIEAFKAEADDVKSYARGRNKPIALGQVGIRCIHCTRVPMHNRGRGSVYFPSRLLGLYQAAQNMANSHLCHTCTAMPPPLKEEFRRLQFSKSTIGGGKVYWANAATALGLTDTDENGIRFEASPQQSSAIESRDGSKGSPSNQTR